MANVLEIKHLSTSFDTYDGEVKAVRDVSFSLEEGMITGLIGESGCGKSVTALSILQLLSKRGRIKSGEIWFREQNLVTLTEKQMLNIRGEQIAMIFQNAMTALNPLYTIGNQMAEVISYHKKTSRTETMRRCEEMLKMVGLQDTERCLKAYPHQLSGGMRQRVAIAMALSCEPALLLADEPTTALDVTTQAQILKIIQQMCTELHTSVVLITHDLSVVANTCDRVIVMYGGKVVESGSTEELFENPKHPYTKALLHTVQDLEADHGHRLFSIEGYPPRLLDPPAGCPFAERCPYAMRICQQAMPEHYGPETHQAACWLLDPACPLGGKHHV